MDRLRSFLLLSFTLLSFLAFSQDGNGNNGNQGNPPDHANNPAAGPDGPNGRRFRIGGFEPNNCTAKPLLRASNKKMDWTAFGDEDFLDNKFGSLFIPDGWHVQIFDNQNFDDSGWNYVVTTSGCLDLSAFPDPNDPTAIATIDLSGQVSSLRVLKTDTWVREWYDPDTQTLSLPE